MSRRLDFLPSPNDLPAAGDPARARLNFEHWDERVHRLDDAGLAGFARELAADPGGKALLEAVFGNSPFLSDLIIDDIAGLRELLTRGPDAVLAETRDGMIEAAHTASDRNACMAALRRARRRNALGTALADIAGQWSLDQVTEALTAFADAAVEAALTHLLLQAAARGDVTPADSARPTEGCGLVVIAMGKMGARELNYSSDIDLIVITDPENAPYHGRKDAQEFFVKLTRDMVTLLQERTRDGYVARVDLRLRPDPSSMPVAIPFQAAETYYESLGQNWERAAMIKARAAAGDRPLGKEFLGMLRPFVWRKHLDFWAIQDVHSIKRQIYAHRGGSTVAIAGHNVKLGRGGIREIEFYVQTQQLIWGGREPELRQPRTKDALAALAEAGHISGEDATALSTAYDELRRLEHRLQMIDDHQTHSLPESDDDLTALATFMDFDDLDSFRQHYLEHLRTVEDRYAGLFEEEPSLSGEGNLVFTGGEPDPDTLQTLSRLGFQDGAKVFELVSNWHRGRYRATRSRRSREILTELLPTLLEALGRTANPDAALIKFDEFLAGLPAGVQLFSMLYANPNLLDLLAKIVGAAPALADHLSGKPGLLDAVLEPGFFEAIPEPEDMRRDLESALADARDFQDVLDIARRWTNDRKFQVGVHLLLYTRDVDEVGRALSDVAETALAGLWPYVLEEFARSHGHLPGPGMAVLALGKLGGREMTISSDLDLIFLYEVAEDAEQSDGPKPLEPGRYYARLAQRYINAVTALTGEGRLYEIDMRLRPSGNAGPIATTLNGFRRYHAEDAWTWEHMALTRARPIVGEAEFCGRIEDAIREVLTAPRDPDKLVRDVSDMRRRIADAHPPTSEWRVKYLRGGLVDLEFLAQTLQLRHAEAHPEVLAAKTQEAFERLAEAGCVADDTARTLVEATRLMRQVQGLIRLMGGPGFDEASAPEGLKAELAKSCQADDFEALRGRLLAAAEAVRHIYDDVIAGPAGAAPIAQQAPETQETRA